MRKRRSTPRATGKPTLVKSHPLATISGIEGLLAGRTLVGRYLVEEVIGRGGMGAVYRARDRQLGRAVAVKVITVAAPDPEAHERLRSRFHREARAAAALHHPCVVSVHDYGTDPQLRLDFIVMELLRGEDLAARLERTGLLAAPAALAVLEQASRGLAAGHRAGLIHRDVKPGNIYLEPGDRAGELRVKILDFGIAELGGSGGDTMTHLTVAGRAPFSPAFASPEQLRGESRLTPATDVFSLAAVGFQLLTGRRLFSTPEARQMRLELSRTFAEERRRLDSISPALTRLLERALSEAPGDRHADGAALADDLLHLLRATAGAPHVAASGPAVVEQPSRQQRHSTPETRPPEWEASDPGVTILHDETMAAAPAWEPSPIRVPLEQRSPRRRARAARWLRRAAVATWSFLLTAGAIGAFAGSWFAAFLGISSGDVDLVYAGAAASILATPLALHRLMGRRGILGLGVFASLAVTLGCVYWLGAGRMEVVLGAVFTAQLAVCMLVERLTARPHAVTESPGERD